MYTNDIVVYYDVLIFKTQLREIKIICFFFRLFGAFLLLLILCTLLVAEKIDTIQRAFFLRRKVQRWDEEKTGGIFSIYNSNKV